MFLVTFSSKSVVRLPYFEEMDNALTMNIVLQAALTHFEITAVLFKVRDECVFARRSRPTFLYSAEAPICNAFYSIAEFLFLSLSRGIDSKATHINNTLCRQEKESFNDDKIAARFVIQRMQEKIHSCAMCAVEGQ